MLASFVILMPIPQAPVTVASLQMDLQIGLCRQRVSQVFSVAPQMDWTQQ